MLEYEQMLERLRWEHRVDAAPINSVLHEILEALIERVAKLEEAEDQRRELGKLGL